MLRRLGIVAGVLALLALGLYLAASSILASDAVRAQIERQLASALGQPVRIASAGASIFPRVAVDLQDVSIGEPAAVHVAHLRVTTGLRGLLSRRVEDAEVQLADGRIVLPLPFAIESGDTSRAPGSTGGGVTIASIKVISLKNVTLVAGARTLQLDMESSLAGDRLDVTSLGARAEKTRIKGRGVLTSVSRMEGRFDAEASPLDLDEMIAIGSAMTAAPPRRSGAPARRDAPARPEQSTLHLVVAMKAPSGEFAGNVFRDLSATLDVAAGRFALSPFSVRLFGGTVNGSIAAGTSTPVPRLQLDARLAGISMPELMKATGSPGAVTGTLGGTARITADGDDPARIMRSAHGPIEAAIVNGDLPRLDMVRSVVLAFGKPSGAPPKGSGTAFSRLGGTFALNDGVLTTDDLALASRDLDMRGRGTVALASGAVSAKADVALSSDLTAQAGTDLRRYAQQDGRVVLPAVIGGTLSQPSVSLDVAAAGRRAIENELHRRLSDALGGLFKKKKGGGG